MEKKLARVQYMGKGSKTIDGIEFKPYHPEKVKEVPLDLWNDKLENLDEFLLLKIITRKEKLSTSRTGKETKESQIDVLVVESTPTVGRSFTLFNMADYLGEKEFKVRSSSLYYW